MCTIALKFDVNYFVKYRGMQKNNFLPEMFLQGPGGRGQGAGGHDSCSSPESGLNILLNTTLVQAIILFIFKPT